MIVSKNLVTAGLLLAVLALSTAGAQSKTVGEDDDSKGLRKHIEHEEKSPVKRDLEEGDSSDQRRSKRGHKSKKLTTEAPGSDKASTTSSKPSLKKHIKTAKKAIDDALDVSTTTTTKKPESTTPPPTDKKPSAVSSAPTGKTAGSKTKKPNQAVDKRDGTSTPPPARATGHRSATHTKPGPMQAATQALEDEEKVALEHMLAGVYDWIKVLSKTGGVVIRKKNMLLAGEFLDKLNNKALRMLGEMYTPQRLIEYHQTDREKKRKQKEKEIALEIQKVRAKEMKKEMEED